MKYLIDTSVCIDVMQGKAKARSELSKLKREACCISSIVKAELMVGVHKSRYSSRQKQILEAFLEGLEVLPFDEAAADLYGDLRAKLESAGTAVGGNDMLIAAHAISAKLTLLTSDKHSERIDRLKVKVWAKRD